MNINIGIDIQLEKLIESRLLIQANSGGGKSYAIRKLLEETNGKVQQIVLDLEGEFFSLREKYEFVVFGKEGDYPVNIKYADKVARTLLELKVSAIIDLYELKHHERILFVKRFLDSMMNAPKELWHSCLVVIDEAHIFAPEKGSAESLGSVIDLCTRGRKRGYCAVIATQRLSKLHKDAAAECNNKLIGRTGLDVDMKRAGDELGFTSKHDMLSLRDLSEGNFFAFGPAISNKITQFKVTSVNTTHPKTGSRLLTVTPPSDKIKKVLEQIKDLPEEAEKELTTIQDYKKEINSLKIQLGQAKSAANKGISPEKTKEFTDQISQLKEENRNLKKQFIPYQKALDKITKEIAPLTETISLEGIEIKVGLPSELSKEQFRNLPSSITGGASRMLKAAAMFYPQSITKMRMAALAGLSYRSGTFGTYLATLKRTGFIQETGGKFLITLEGLNEAGNFEPLPTDPELLINMWCGIVGGGAARMLKALAENYPHSMTNEELGEAAELNHTSGTFGTYKATLKRNGLIEVSKNSIKISDEFYN
jgi:gas vesicle protein